MEADRDSRGSKRKIDNPRLRFTACLKGQSSKECRQPQFPRARVRTPGLWRASLTHHHDLDSINYYHDSSSPDRTSPYLRPFEYHHPVCLRQDRNISRMTRDLKHPARKKKPGPRHILRMGKAAERLEIPQRGVLSETW